MRFLLLSMLISFTGLVSCPAETAVEAGNVSWGRDLKVALARSRDSGKPVFALFQEIPGCAGCQQFGREVMSHPLVVEAVETEFVPLLIHNNKPGKDAELLRLFGEPAWNYQVVRFLDADAKDIIPRRDQVWDTHGITRRMIETLTKAKRPVPEYLRLLSAEQSPALKQAVFSMYCFWTGEMELGKIEGVITTEAGFHDGHEVTLVRYDPAVITLAGLIKAAESVRCANAVHVPAEDLPQAKAQRISIGVISAYRSAPAADQKKQLQGTAVAALTLSPAQATKVNAWLRSDAEKALPFLSPAQRSRLAFP